jgi:hypothetical protein
MFWVERGNQRGVQENTTAGRERQKSQKPLSPTCFYDLSITANTFIKW